MLKAAFTLMSIPDLDRGSAVMMEETIFDYIDDYLQYTDSYFLNPGMSFLNQIQNNVIYTNSLLILYLYKFAGNTPGIDF